MRVVGCITRWITQSRKGWSFREGCFEPNSIKKLSAMIYNQRGKANEYKNKECNCFGVIIILSFIMFSVY